MTKEAHDQFCCHTELGFCHRKRGENAADCSVKRDATFGMSLRIKKDLDMVNIVSTGPIEIGHCEVEEIFFGSQDAHALIINIQKIL